MTDTPEDPKQTRFLLTSLVIILIFILTLVFLAGGYPVLLAPDPTATATITPPLIPTSTPSPSPTLTLTPTITNTPRPTFTPTLTLTPVPTFTPSPTPTPTGPPTLTPASPLPVESRYALADWSAEDAARLIELLNHYPNTLNRQDLDDDPGAYYEAFSYAAAAQQEALLRFPESSQATPWRWDLPYNMARIGDEKAGSLYAALVEEALNEEQVAPARLTTWIQTQEPRLQASFLKLTPAASAEDRYLLELEAQGSAFILLERTSSGFQAEALASEFSFIDAPQFEATAGDLTGDGFPEVVIFQSGPTASFQMTPPQVFDSTRETPRELPFLPSQSSFPVGMEFESEWQVVAGPSGDRELIFSTTIFPACPVVIQARYRWNGEHFANQGIHYTADPGVETLGYCRLMIDHAAQVWGPEAALSLLETVLPNWPPREMEDGSPPPVDAKDEMRFRLGVYQALTGEFENARGSFQQVINQPAALKSRWVDASQQFLAAYQAPNDVYRACVGAPLCSPADALHTLIRDYPGESYSAVLEHLRQAGVGLAGSGMFDFDQDGEEERWFTVRYRPGEKLEFWILASSQEAIRALRVGTVESDAPEPTSQDLSPDTATVWIDSSTAITLNRDPETREPSIQHQVREYAWVNRFEEGVKTAQEELFSGADPREVQQALKTLETNPGLLCAPTWSCDRYYYLLGLASELAGDERQAVHSYWRLWQDYSKSPFTTMARLKLTQQGRTPAAPTASVTPRPASSATAAPPTLTPTP